MHLVVVTNVVRPPHWNVYSVQERLEHTRWTLESIMRKIPNSYIVMLEGGSSTEEDRWMWLDQGATEVFVIDVMGKHKSIGEAMMLLTYFESQEFKRIREFVDIVHKLSGRYWLTDRFTLSEDESSRIYKEKREPRYQTRYYKFHMKTLDYFVKKLYEILKDPNFSLWSNDIENYFYKYQVLAPEGVVNPEVIGVSGYIAPTKQLISE